LSVEGSAERGKAPLEKKVVIVVSPRKPGEASKNRFRSQLGDVLRIWKGALIDAFPLLIQICKGCYCQRKKKKVSSRGRKREPCLRLLLPRALSPHFIWAKEGFGKRGDVSLSQRNVTCVLAEIAVSPRPRKKKAGETGKGEVRAEILVVSKAKHMVFGEQERRKLPGGDVPLPEEPSAYLAARKRETLLLGKEGKREFSGSGEKNRGGFIRTRVRSFHAGGKIPARRREAALESKQTLTSKDVAR